MLAALTLLKQAKTLTALRGEESLPTLSRTMNIYERPLQELNIRANSSHLRSTKLPLWSSASVPAGVVEESLPMLHLQ
jgi:hypothetical protein